MNRFMGPAVAAPTAINSGQSVHVTLRYQYQPIDPHEPVPEVHMACSPTFQLACVGPVQLAPSANGSVTFTITLTRAKPGAPEACTLIFNALHDERSVAIAVRP